jgi:hypothetical protein
MITYRRSVSQLLPHRHELFPFRPDSAPVLQTRRVVNRPRRGEVAEVVKVIRDRLVVLERLESLLQEVEGFL